ncbi:MAG: universal stress protein [Bacteroidetes bacterium]|nr:universal stress protein [Bacteroidota bacterium]
MKTILTATDFSAAATNAAEYAAEMALAIHAELTLLHVCQIPVTYGEAPAIVNEGDMIQDAELELEKLKDRLGEMTFGKIPIRTIAKLGLFHQELKTTCEELHPYTVVMGCQGSTAADRMLLGDHAVHAMRHLEWPLITVPPEATFGDIRKIGFACDFDHVVDTIPLDEIKTLVKDFNAELHILNTGKQKEFNADTVFESGLLQEMLEGLKPKYHFITNDNIDKGILDYADGNEIDLLIVLPKRHSLLENIFHKSHTKSMVLHSHVPVLALHQ